MTINDMRDKAYYSQEKIYSADKVDQMFAKKEELNALKLYSIHKAIENKEVFTLNKDILADSDNKGHEKYLIKGAWVTPIDIYGVDEVLITTKKGFQQTVSINNLLYYQTDYITKALNYIKGVLKYGFSCVIR